MHEDYNLSAEETETLKRSVGRTSVEVLQALFETDTYKAMMITPGKRAGLRPSRATRECGNGCRVSRVRKRTLS